MKKVLQKLLLSLFIINLSIKNSLINCQLFQITFSLLISKIIILEKELVYFFIDLKKQDLEKKNLSTLFYGMMLKNENSIDKLKVTKSRSTSNILKHKIGIALGREKQVRQNSTNKKNMSKFSSYLSKQKSMSMRSLSKGTLNPKEKLSNSINRKFSFYNDLKTLTKEKQQVHKNKNASQSLKSSKTQRYEKVDSDLINNPYKNLIWLDSSNNRKLKIVSKTIMTLGENRSQECTEYCVQNDKQSSILFRVKQNKLALIEKSNIVLITFDQKSRQQECFSGQKLKKQFSLSFCGYIFIYQSLSIETQMKEIKEKFDFLLQQIQKLYQDGLKDFTIISKIVKRMFQSKFYTNDKQNSFSLLMKIQISQNRNLQQKQLAISRKKYSAAHQLIAQKLFIEKTTSNVRGNSHIMKIQFNKKKFID